MNTVKILNCKDNRVNPGKSTRVIQHPHTHVIIHWHFPHGWICTAYNVQNNKRTNKRETFQAPFPKLHGAIRNAIDYISSYHNSSNSLARFFTMQ